MALRKLTPAEITATRLREMARDLVLEAEALEATIDRPKEKSTPKSRTMVNPVTGKKSTIIFRELGS